MNHLKTHQTSLMAPWDPLNAPLDPLGPPGPPHRPPMTPKQVSCPHWTLQITSPAFQIIRWPIKCHCWSYGTSHPSPSGLYSLVLPSSESSPGYISRTYLVQFGLVLCVLWLQPEQLRYIMVNEIDLKQRSDHLMTLQCHRASYVCIFNVYLRGKFIIRIVSSGQ